ncbi:MAG: RNA-binding domain-containing protein [Candidatus Asgardarchaeia archaeon]
MYVSIRIRAEVTKTEDIQKVIKAIKNAVTLTEDELDILTEDDKLIIIGEKMTLNSIEALHDLIRQDRVIDAIRKALRRSRIGNLVSLKLNREALFSKHINLFAEDSDILPPIEIVIASDEIEKIIDWLAPPTKNGKPLFELRIEDLEQVT